jgi:hypothetical protein
MTAKIVVEVAEVRKLIDGLRWDRRRHPYSGRREYAQRARAVAAAIADMIETDDAASAGPLARRAVERVTAALMYMDDSAGIVGDDLRTLMQLYARACRAAPPDARRLAAWLVSLQLGGPGWPDIELKEFSDALGQRGLAEVARLTEERGATADPDSWTARWGIRNLREQLAAASGDVDAHVAVLAEDLRGARRYSEIVRVLCGAGRVDDAEQWARKGLGEYPSDFQAERLRNQLVELLADSGDVRTPLRSAARSTSGGPSIRTISGSATPPRRRAYGPISAVGRSICSGTGHAPTGGMSPN